MMGFLRAQRIIQPRDLLMLHTQLLTWSILQVNQCKAVGYVQSDEISLRSLFVALHQVQNASNCEGMHCWIHSSETAA